MKLASLALAAAICGASSPAFAQAVRETVVPAFSYPAPNVPGKAVTALVVTYAPGAKTPSHRHGKAFVIAYVLEGAIRSKLGNGESRVYRAGESWTEDPGAHHTMGENASSTEPAKMIAFFVHDVGATDLFVLDSEATKK